MEAIRLTDKQIEQIKKLNIPEEKILWNEPMFKYTSFKIGGPADCLIKIDNIDELKSILKMCKENNIEMTVIGNGSNILVSDNGIDGIVLLIKTDKMEISANEDNTVKVVLDAGAKIGKVAQKLLQESISGFEELSGIPGTIGGAVKMNAGAHGKEMRDITKSVICIDYNGNIKKLKNNEIEFKYRSSIFKKKKCIITQVVLELQKGNKDEIRKKMMDYLQYRKEHQPIEYPSAGSTFKRGNDFITAKLIDEAGLKGYTIGGAMVSEKHSGFIINKGNATSNDVMQLIEYIKKKIMEKFDKEIELEIEIIGRNERKK